MFVDFDSIAIALVIPCLKYSNALCVVVNIKDQWGSNKKCVEKNDATVDAGLDSPDYTYTQILNALSAVSSRLTAIEQRIGKTGEQLQNTTKSGSDGVKLAGLGASSQEELNEDSDAGDDAVIPIIKFLKSSKQIQNAVDHRLQELSRINYQGIYKSQGDGKYQVMVKNQVPWSQNHVLAGTFKNRVTYDSLSTFQWMSGFCSIIREESDVKVKNAMLGYVNDLMPKTLLPKVPMP